MGGCSGRPRITEYQLGELIEAAVVGDITSIQDLFKLVRSGIVGEELRVEHRHRGVTKKSEVTTQVLATLASRASPAFKQLLDQLGSTQLIGDLIDFAVEMANSGLAPPKNESV